MVSTRDSESLNPSSSLGRPLKKNIYIYIYNASLAQWIAHKTSNLGVAGSSPARGDKYIFVTLWPSWLRRWPAKPLGVTRAGSNPAGVE